VFEPADEYPHAEAAVEEWVFAAWAPDASFGLVAGHRLFPAAKRAWYWFALAEHGYPMLHVTEWDVAVRSDPFVVKAPEMWAEHHCVAPLRQWTVANEAHAAGLDGPDEALGRGYGVVVRMAADVEWYAIGGAVAIGDGFVQEGVAHGRVELSDREHREFAEIPARRWRRWGSALGPLDVPAARAHAGLHAAFAFPDGTVADWALTPTGWHTRHPPPTILRQPM